MRWADSRALTAIMARYQVILAYDGTHYQGFQRQRADQNYQNTVTIQGVFEAALRRIGWGGNSILAAGRTDAGVHASGQVVVFDLDWRHSTGELRSALNAQLPVDVAVRQVQPVRLDFHPRYDAIARCYHYRIYQQETRDPLRERYAWRVWPPIELDLLSQIANDLTGKHDFAAFGRSPRRDGRTERTVISANWRRTASETGKDLSPDLFFEIVADGFLYRMVRRLVYVHVAIGSGKLDSQALFHYLNFPASGMVQGLAPPQGLSLVRVDYPDGFVLKN